MYLGNQESTADESDAESSDEEMEEPPTKKTPGKYKVSVYMYLHLIIETTLCIFPVESRAIHVQQVDGGSVAEWSAHTIQRS